MGFNLKSIIKKKDTTQASGVMGVKKSTQTTDSIISQAVSSAGNISNMTLSKEEHDRLLTARHKMPIGIIILKYISLTFMAGVIVSGLLLKADLSPENDYLSLLGVNDSTGSEFIRLSGNSDTLEQENLVLQSEINSLKERSRAFEDSSDAGRVSLLKPEIIEIEKLQRIWFNKTVTVQTRVEDDDEDPSNDEFIEEDVFKYGLIDSFSDMIEYFEDEDYQPRFFNQKNRDESISDSESRSQSTFIMANDINIRGLNVTTNGANVTVSASDLLSRVFTLSSEFVAMMNSFDFYKGAEVTNFSRREVAEGGDQTEIALRLEFQEEDEEDPNDVYLVDLIEWQNQPNSTD